ncbi:MAG: NAD(P)H-dependent oxidoreductase [Flavobacteriia bacterium]|nr:NAD(P)H-dependent oxidoreductase [Flavobacteriia bacterium]
MNKIIEDLKWRYATKKYDSTKKVSIENIEIIKDALRLTPTAFGLQPLKFIIVENQDVRLKLKEKSHNQEQVVDASHLLVLCSYIDNTEIHVEDYIDLIVDTRNVAKENLEGFKEYINNTINPIPLETKTIWNAKQAYIALGNLLHTCAALRIDATPMEGFEPEGYDEVLGLKAKNLKATIVCPIGYRHPEDRYQHLTKVRKHHDDLFEVI